MEGLECAHEGGEEIFPCGSFAPLKSLTHWNLFFLFSHFVPVVTGFVVLPECSQVEATEFTTMHGDSHR